MQRWGEAGGGRQHTGSLNHHRQPQGSGVTGGHRTEGWLLPLAERILSSTELQRNKVTPPARTAGSVVTRAQGSPPPSATTVFSAWKCLQDGSRPTPTWTMSFRQAAMEDLACGPVSAAGPPRSTRPPRPAKAPDKEGLLSGAGRVAVRGRTARPWNKASSQARPSAASSPRCSAAGPGVREGRIKAVCLSDWARVGCGRTSGAPQKGSGVCRPRWRGPHGPRSFLGTLGGRRARAVPSQRRSLGSEGARPRQRGPQTGARLPFPALPCARLGVPSAPFWPHLY